MRTKLLRIAYQILRNPLFSTFIGWMFRHMAFALPLTFLRQTNLLLAFWHPKPSYPFHVVLVPRKQIATLAELDPSADAPFLTELYTTAQALIAEHQLKSYRLIVNGGEYQDFPYLHFHLISGKE